MYRVDNTNDARSITGEISEVLRDYGTPLLQTLVPSRVVYREAATRQVPVHVHEPHRRRGTSAAQTLQELKLELTELLDTIHPLSDASQEKKRHLLVWYGARTKIEKTSG